MRFKAHIVLGLFLLGLLAPSLAWAEETESDNTPSQETPVAITEAKKGVYRTCRDAWGKLSWKQRIGIGGLGLVGAYFVPSYKGPVARVMGKKHVGYGIMLDTQNIMNKLTPEERKLFEYPQDNLSQILPILVAKLDSPFEPASNTHYFNLRSASTLMDTDSKTRGRGRHKAVALWALMRDFGIDAKLQVAHTKKGHKEHQIVYFPDSDLLVDFYKKTPLQTASQFWAQQEELEEGLKLSSPDFEPSFRDHR